MKPARAKIKAMTGRSQVGQELKVVIGRLNQFLRGWGSYFRTGNASIKFCEIDKYVWWRLLRLLVKKRGRNLRAGQADRWTPAWFHDQGLYHLHGTIRYPKAQRNHVRKTVGKPYTGKPHVWIEGDGEPGSQEHRAPDYQWSASPSTDAGRNRPNCCRGGGLPSSTARPSPRCIWRRTTTFAGRRRRSSSAPGLPGGHHRHRHAGVVGHRHDVGHG
ncbi:MAG: group II intron maturase-specific domain-containing protein [Acidimicrobiales bacterium]